MLDPDEVLVAADHYLVGLGQYTNSRRQGHRPLGWVPLRHLGVEVVLSHSRHLLQMVAYVVFLL